MDGVVAVIDCCWDFIKKQAHSSEVRTLTQKIAGAFSRWIHPSAIVVLVSGIILIANMYGSVEDRPFWLDYMEMAGMVIVFASIILLSFVSNRMVRKPLRMDHVDMAKISRGLTTYIILLAVLVVLIASVILMVTLRV